MNRPDRTTTTYRNERFRSVAAGILETASTTFLLLIAVKHFQAGAIAKGLVASGGSVGFMLGPVAVSLASRARWTSSKAASAASGAGAVVFRMKARGNSKRGEDPGQLLKQGAGDRLD